MRALAALCFVGLQGCNGCVQTTTRLNADLSITFGGVSAPQPIRFPFQDLGDPVRGRGISLPLKPGYVAFATRTAFARSQNGVLSWFGSVGPQGSVAITVHGSHVLGTVVDGPHVYSIENDVNGVPHVRPQAVPSRPLKESPFRFGNKPVPRPELSPIQLLAVYTKRAATDCGDMELVATHAVNEANLVATLTGLKTRFELAATHETDFDESNSGMGATVSSFASTTDSELNEVHAWRKDAAADVAVLFVSPPKSAEDGASAQTMADKLTAFSVVNCRTERSYYTLAHELGHLLGLNDDDDPVDQVTFADGYGLVHEGRDNMTCWRTVMSARSSCNCGCGVIPFWSNPSVRYPLFFGAATGVAGKSDNARVIGQTAGAVSAFQ